MLQREDSFHAGSNPVRPMLIPRWEEMNEDLDHSVTPLVFHRKEEFFPEEKHLHF